MGQQTCMNCGNKYDKSFQVTLNSQEYTFDCFECAINKLAPTCLCCGTKIIGHGVEADSQMYCCAHCAKMSGVMEIVDRKGSHENAFTNSLKA